MQTTEQLQAILDAEVERTKAAMADGVDIPPHLALVKDTPPPNLILVMFELPSRESKHEIMRQMGEGIRRTGLLDNVAAVMMVTDSYYLATPSEGAMSLIRSGLATISDMKTRKEAYTHVVFALDGRNLGRLLPYDRLSGKLVPNNDEVPKLGEEFESSLMEDFFKGAGLPWKNRVSVHSEHDKTAE